MSLPKHKAEVEKLINATLFLIPISEQHLGDRCCQLLLENIG